MVRHQMGIIPEEVSDDEIADVFQVRTFFEYFPRHPVRAFTASGGWSHSRQLLDAAPLPFCMGANVILLSCCCSSSPRRWMPMALARSMPANWASSLRAAADSQRSALQDRRRKEVVVAAPRLGPHATALWPRRAERDRR